MELTMEEKKYEISSIIYLIISLISFFYIISFNTSTDYSMLWLLPSSYFSFLLLYCFVSKKLNNYKSSLMLLSVNIVISIRYAVTPLFMVITSSYNGLGYGTNPATQNIDYAILLMIIELFTVYIVLLFATTHYSKKQTHVLQNNKIYFLKNKFILLIFVSSVLPLIIFYSPSSLLPNIGTLFSEISTSITSNDNFNSILSIMSNSVKLSVLFILISKIKIKYNINNKMIYIFCAWGLVFLYLSTILSMSRWNLLFSSIVCIMLMMELFPKTPKIVFFSIALLAFTGVIMISINKYSWSLRNSANPFIDIFKVLFGQFQEYFSGPRPVAQSIEMSYFFQNQINLQTMLNDFLGSIPGIANIIEQTNRSNWIFNVFLGLRNNTHIIPMIGQGYSHMPFFPMVYTIIFCWFTVHFDYKYSTSNTIELKYIYGFIGLFFSMFMGFNTQIIWGNFLNSFLPLWLLFNVNKKITI